MASTSQGGETSAADAGKVQDPVEMSTLQSPAAGSATDGTDEVSQLPSASTQPLKDITEADATSGAEQSQPTTTAPTSKSATPSRLTRAQSEALGPSTESPIHPPLPTANRGPTLSITLMLITGARHPYKIDEKYLRNRKVNVPEGKEFEPRDISGYQLKELIWTDWRTEWEPRPQSPSSIRLILLGRFVEDKALLKGESCRTRCNECKESIGRRLC